MRVLVAGATGFVGRRLVPALVEANHDVTVIVRNAEDYSGTANRVIEGDLLERGSFEAAFDKVEAAYYLVHSMRSGENFEAHDRRAARHFSRAASEAGLARVIYLGGLGETRDDLSAHLRSRREVEAILGAGDYELTVLRAAIIIGAGSVSFDMILQLAARLPVMVTPRWVRTPCQPIAIDDVIAYLVGVLDHPGSAGETYEIGGPEVLTYESILRRTASIATGRELIVVPVPILSPQLSTYWVDLVTNVPRHVAHPLILGLKNPVVVHDHSIREVLPLDLTPFDVAVTRALERTRPRLEAH